MAVSSNGNELQAVSAALGVQPVEKGREVDQLTEDAAFVSQQILQKLAGRSSLNSAEASVLYSALEHYQDQGWAPQFLEKLVTELARHDIAVRLDKWRLVLQRNGQIRPFCSLMVRGLADVGGYFFAGDRQAAVLAAKNVAYDIRTGIRNGKLSAGATLSLDRFLNSSSQANMFVNMNLLAGEMRANGYELQIDDNHLRIARIGEAYAQRCSASVPLMEHTRLELHAAPTHAHSIIYQIAGEIVDAAAEAFRVAGVAFVPVVSSRIKDLLRFACRHGHGQTAVVTLTALLEPHGYTVRADNGKMFVFRGSRQDVHGKPVATFDLPAVRADLTPQRALTAFEMTVQVSKFVRSLAVRPGSTMHLSRTHCEVLNQLLAHCDKYGQLTDLLRRLNSQLVRFGYKMRYTQSGLEISASDGDKTITHHVRIDVWCQDE